MQRSKLTADGCMQGRGVCCGRSRGDLGDIGSQSECIIVDVMGGEFKNNGAPSAVTTIAEFNKAVSKSATPRP